MFHCSFWDSTLYVLVDLADWFLQKSYCLVNFRQKWAVSQKQSTLHLFNKIKTAKLKFYSFIWFGLNRPLPKVMFTTKTTFVQKEDFPTEKLSVGEFFTTLKNKYDNAHRKDYRHCRSIPAKPACIKKEKDIPRLPEIQKKLYQYFRLSFPFI